MDIDPPKSPTSTASRNGWRQNLTLVALSATIASIACFMAAEIAVRFREANRKTPPGSIPFVEYRHTRLRTALARDLNYFGWIHVDSEGFRGPEVRAAKQPGVLRVMAVGASTTFDFQTTADSETWPAQLQRLLRRDGYHVEVINAGIPGYTVLDNYVRLEFELYRYHPDLVILYHAHNDLYNALHRALQEADAAQRPSGGQRPGQVPTEGALARWLSEHSLLFAKVRTGLALRFHRAALRREGKETVLTTPEWNTTLSQGAADFGRNLAAFLAVARQLGMRVVMPEVVDVSGLDTVEADSHVRWIWEQSVRGVPVDVVLRGYRRYNGQIRALAACFGALYVPADSALLKGIHWYGIGDPIHFNDAGALRFATHIAGALESPGALASGGALNPASQTLSCAQEASEP